MLRFARGVRGLVGIAAPALPQSFLLHSSMHSLIENWFRLDNGNEGSDRGMSWYYS